MPVNDLGDEAAAAIFVGKDFVFRSKVVIWSQILSSLSQVLLSAESCCRQPVSSAAPCCCNTWTTDQVEADKKTFLPLRLDNDEKNSVCHQLAQSQLTASHIVERGNLKNLIYKKALEANQSINL